MASGNTDFQVPVVVTIDNTFSAIDELAARLGSPVNFERSGSVLYADDMSGGLSPYIQNISGTTGTITVDTTKSAYGKQCIKMVSSAVIIETISLEFYRGGYNSVRSGIEIIFARERALAQTTLYMQLKTDAARVSGMVRLDAVNDEIQYMDSSGIFVKLDDYPFSNHSFRLWSTLKIVLDRDAGKYVRVIFNERTYNINAGAFISPDTGLQFTLVRISANNDALGGSPSSTQWIGGLIYTANEPE